MYTVFFIDRIYDRIRIFFIRCTAVHKIQYSYIFNAIYNVLLEEYWYCGAGIRLVYLVPSALWQQVTLVTSDVMNNVTRRD